MTRGDAEVLAMFGIHQTGTACRRLSRRVSTFTVWVLIAGFLLQPVLAYLVTPVLAHDAKGQQIVICTLKGAKSVRVDLPAIADQGGDAEHCSALKLYQMAGTAQLAEAPVLPPVVLYSIAVVDQTARHAHRALHFSAYSTRAPPVA